MGRGPEQSGVRRIARTVLLGLAGAGVAAGAISVANSTMNTSELYRTVNRSVEPSEGVSFQDKYNDAYWEKVFAKLDATGVTEQSHKDATVAYGGMIVSLITGLAGLALFSSNNRPAPQRSR